MADGRDGTGGAEEAFGREFDQAVDAHDFGPPPGAGSTCGWCNAPLEEPDERVCPRCGAALRPEGEEPAVPGVTVTPWDPMVARAAADALASAAGAGLPEEGLVGTGHPAFAQPDRGTRMAMRDVAASAEAGSGPRVSPGGEVVSLAESGVRQEEYVPPRRLPVPGQPFVPEERLDLGAPGHRATEVFAGLTRPSSTEDGWWLAVLYARDELGLVDAEEIAGPGAPPAAPPLAVIGPVLAGALSGLLLEEGGRQQLRLALPSPDDEANQWRRPLVVRMAARWEPARAATMSPEELASTALAAFRRALEVASSHA